MKVFIALSVILVGVFAQEAAQPSGIAACYEQDSITCVQNMVRIGLQCIYYTTSALT